MADQMTGYVSRGWWHDMPTELKVVTVGGAVAGVSLVAWGIHWLMRPKPIKDISENCNEFTFATETEVNEAILPLLKSARSSSGNVDPFYVTTLFLKQYASKCRSYPEEARNVGEAQMYVQAFSKVVALMQGQKMISPDQVQYFYEMVAVWGRSQGLSPSQLPQAPVPSPSGLRPEATIQF